MANDDIPLSGIFDDIPTPTKEPLRITVPRPREQESPSATKSAAIGAHQGVTMGWADEIAGLGGASGLPVGTPPIVSIPVGLYRKWTGAPGAEEGYKQARDAFRGVEAAAEKEHPYATLGGQVAGTLAGAVAPARVVGAGASLLGQVGRGVALGAATGAVQGAGEAKERADMPTGAAIGAGIGGAIGAVAPVVVRAVTPNPIPAHKQAAINVLRREGVDDLTAGQQTGRKGLRYFESEMGGEAAERTAQNQGEQFTAAVLRRVGENAPRATPDVIDNALARIGQQFDDLAARNTMMVDAQFGRDMLQILRDYHSVVNPSARAPIVENTIRDIYNAAMANGGRFPGETYQSLRTQLDKAARRSRNDPQLQDALFGLRGAIDDVMERSISPADQAAWREARNQYRNMLVVEKAATGGGEMAADGIISPAQLKTAVKAQNLRAYARGRSDLGDLARAGESIMKPLPQSGTAPRLAAHGVTHAVTGGIGATAGDRAGGTEGAVVGGIAGFAAPRVAAHAALSDIGRRYLTNQVAAGAAPIIAGNVISAPVRANLVDRSSKRQKPPTRR